jgi:histone deacetylase complex regulatory component SIN3
MSEPEKYQQFFEILQNYQREAISVQEVYTSVVTLFSSAPELVEDFKLFLP